MPHAIILFSAVAPYKSRVLRFDSGLQGSSNCTNQTNCWRNLMGRLSVTTDSSWPTAFLQQLMLFYNQDSSISRLGTQCPSHPDSVNSVAPKSKDFGLLSVDMRIRCKPWTGQVMWINALNWKCHSYNETWNKTKAHCVLIE